MEYPINQIFIHSSVVSSSAGQLSSILRKENIQLVAERCYYEIIRYEDSAVLEGGPRPELHPLYIRELEGAAYALYDYYTSDHYRTGSDDEYYNEDLIPDPMGSISEILYNFHILKEKRTDLTDYQLTEGSMDMNESIGIITAMTRKTSRSEYFRNAVLSVGSAWDFLKTLSKEHKEEITARRLDNYLETTAKDIFSYAQSNELSSEEIDMLRKLGKSNPMRLIDLTDNSWMYCT